MKIIFLGTPELAIEVLHAVHEEHSIVAVLTQPDKPHGRSKKLIPSPVSIEAEKLGLQVYKPEKITDDLIQTLKALEADIFLTFAYGIILPEPFLKITPLGGINIHPSKLPKLRGPSPIKTALLNGAVVSGITIQKVHKKVDRGDILFRKSFDITPEDDEVSLEEKVGRMSADIINSVLYEYSAKKITPIPQNENDATYCTMFKKEDGRIDWSKPAASIINKIRAFSRWPVAFTFLEGKKVNIFKAHLNGEFDFEDFDNYHPGRIVKADKKSGILVKTKDALISIQRLQLEGKNILDYKDFMNGYKNLCDKLFTLERTQESTQ